MRRKLLRSQAEIRNKSVQDEAVLEELLQTDSRAGAGSRFIWKDAHFPVH